MLWSIFGLTGETTDNYSGITVKYQASCGVHIYDPSIQKTEAGEPLQVEGQPGLHSDLNPA